MGRHIGFMADHIDEMQGDQPGRGALLAIAPDPADVMGVAQRHGNESGLFGALDAEFGQPAGHHLAVAALAVIEQDRALLAQDPAGAIGNQRAGGEIAHIAGNHADAMAVMAAEVRLHEMIGHDPGLRRRAAGGDEDPGGRRPQ